MAPVVGPGCFCEPVTLFLKCKDCEDRRAVVRVFVDVVTSTSPIHKKDLVVRLTDDEDPFFLYNLTLGEEDFQILKNQQGLLVDFSSFPQKFIDLLKLCIDEQSKEVPRFLLQLICSSSLAERGPACLNVVETNSFKHLTHLSLCLLPGSDNEIKKYLASCLRSLKEENTTLQYRICKTDEDLTQRLNHSQQALAERNRELERLKSEWSTHTSSLNSQHSHELSAAREHVLQLQTESQNQLEKQRRELENTHRQTMQMLQCRLTETESSNKDLTERRFKAEASLREVRTRLSALEEESSQAKQELVKLRRDSSVLEEQRHEQEKALGQVRTRSAVLEQECKEKEALTSRLADNLANAQQQKAKLEDCVEERRLQVGKLETTIKSLSEELLKANEIIKRLQGEIKNLQGKVKLKNAVTMQQERLLEDKDKALQRNNDELVELRATFGRKEDEVAKLQDKLDLTVKKLEEGQKLLRTNENVITWLNKQLNESQMAAKPHVAIGSQGDERSGYQAHVGLGAAVPYNSLSIGGQFSRFVMPSTTSIAAATSTASAMNIGSMGIRIPSVHSRLAIQPHQVHFAPQVIQTSTPLSEPWSIPSSAQPHAAPRNLSDPTGLDPKYLEHREDSIPLRAISVLPSGMAAAPSRPGGLKQASLTQASAYFQGPKPGLSAS
uniref:spindle assembly abnormal protein 6 homolog n=1 Tax=Myxine glutinosa TaxID=7769 RepID=UPI00358ED828